jgi:hypothetical protein
MSVTIVQQNAETSNGFPLNGGMTTKGEEKDICHSK